MYLRAYRLKNYRRLRDVLIELGQDISIFVGANNSGKTSAAQAIQMFVSGRREQFSLFDFSSHCWKILDDLGAADAAQDATAELQGIAIDLWIEVSEPDLYLVLPILPSSEWEGTEVGIRIEFGPRNLPDMLRRYREAKATATEHSAVLGANAGTYIPWPRTLTDYLQKELHTEFELKYFVLDRAQFNVDHVPAAGYQPAQIITEPGGAAIIKSLIRVDYLHAQRHLADPSASITGSGGRSEDLSRRLSRFYQRNLRQHPEDHSALKALFDSEEGLNKHLMEVFKPTLERIAKLGYPGMHNPKLEIRSGLNPATVMSQDAKVHYVLDADTALHLPDSYNGLGFKNLIYMVVEILDAQEKWRLDDPRAPLHVVIVEEPEAHLHAQLQQVFIRNILELMKIDGEEDGAFLSQAVITTHSPHILYERGFDPIRYFRRHTLENNQSSSILNLSKFQPGDAPKDRDFLQRYMKLTHCDLFFADAAILVEGNVERLLLPLMIEKDAKRLRSAALSILEVGGAFGHRFRELIHFLGISTLVITDLDSVVVVDVPDLADEDQEKEFEVPADIEGQPPIKRAGRTCLPSVAGASTSNQTLIQWLPKKATVADLLLVPDDEKIEAIAGTDNAMVRVAYQVSTSVTWSGTTEQLCGRTLEESFGLENANWCQHVDQASLGLKLRGVANTPPDLSLGLHKRITGRNFDKTKFALGVLTKKQSDWTTPEYIKQGLRWLENLVNLEPVEEVVAVAEIAQVVAAVEGDA